MSVFIGPPRPICTATYPHSDGGRWQKWVLYQRGDGSFHYQVQSNTGPTATGTGFACDVVSFDDWFQKAFKWIDTFEQLEPLQTATDEERTKITALIMACF